jgi:hypothetical protein
MASFLKFCHLERELSLCSWIGEVRESGAMVMSMSLVADGMFSVLVTVGASVIISRGRFCELVSGPFLTVPFCSHA